MVARSPPKYKKMVTPLNSTLLTETLNKVDKCLARLQELQYTANGGSKLISGVNLSPRSTRSYLRTSLRCKQESARIRNATPLKSSAGTSTNRGEWQRMSLPAMLLRETMEEIIQTTQFAREIVSAIAPTISTTTTDDPKTPLTVKENQRPKLDDSELRERRNREKQTTLPSIRLNTNNPRLQPAKSHINFKISTPLNRKTNEENCQHFVANRVPPRNQLWAKKAVLLPHAMFHSSSPLPNQLKFCKTKSSVTKANRQKTPHKFLVKSPGASASKFQVNIKSPPVTLSPTRNLCLNKRSPKVFTETKLRRSFSQSKLANRLVSPLKSTKSFIEKSDGMKIMMSGLKQRPSCSTSISFIARRN